MRHATLRPLSVAVALALVCQTAVSERVAHPVAASRAQSAYAAADAGYGHYGRGDYAAAIRDARRAVQLEPQRRAYWLLLAQASLADGRLDDAKDAVDHAATAPGDELSLSRLRGEVLAARSQAAGEALYHALAAGDLQAAQAAGHRAVELAPDNLSYRLAFVHALMREQRYAEAERMADSAVQQRPQDAAPLLLRALARQALSREAEAAADVEAALRFQSTSRIAMRNAHLVAADLALAQGRGDAALQVLQVLDEADADARARRDWIRSAAVSPGQVPALKTGVPGIDCGAAAGEGSCMLLATEPPALPGFDDATAGYAAMESGDYARALERARLAVAAAPGKREWRLLQVHAAVATGDLAEAESAATAALGQDPSSDARALAQRSWIRTRLGYVEQARDDATAALVSGALPPASEAAMLLALGRRDEARERLNIAAQSPMSPAERLQLAYLAIQARDDAGALRAFQQADAEATLPTHTLFDAGYAAMRAHRDAEALAFFDRAVVATRRRQPVSTEQQIYDAKRMSAEVERTWGILASLTYRNGAGVEPGFGAVGPAGDQRTTQGGVEGYWRPFGYRNGQYVEVFARGFGTFDARGNTFTGSDSFQGGVGARWKPFTDHNFVVGLSRVFGPNVHDSWLAQAGYSYDHGGELRLDLPSWWTGRFYVEAGKYFGSGTTAGSYGVASAMLGRSYIAGESRRTVLYPHLFLGAEHRSRDASAKTSTGVGVGIGVRHWFREDDKRGPRSYWDVALQYRFRLSGDDRLKGPFLSATLSF